MAIGLRAVTSRQVAYFLAWFHKELVVFRSSFFSSRLAAARSIRDEIARDQFQHLIDEFLLLPGRVAGCCDEARPMAQRIKSPLEA